MFRTASGWAVPGHSSRAEPCVDEPPWPPSALHIPAAESPVQGPEDVPGARRQVGQALLQAVRRQLQLVNKPPVVLAKTGYPVGEVSPVGFKQTSSVLFDERILGRPVVYGGGGRPELLLRITPRDIIALTEATVCDIAKE